MHDIDELIRRDKERNRLCVEFQQHGKMVGIVEKKDFENSGEVPGSMLILDMIKYWNAKEENVALGLTAHLIFHEGPL